MLLKLNEIQKVLLIYFFHYVCFGYGYDKVHQYNPVGRLIQLERAKKAYLKGFPVVGVKCLDGLIVAVFKKRNISKLIRSSPAKAFQVNKNIKLFWTKDLY